LASIRRTRSVSADRQVGGQAPQRRLDEQVLAHDLGGAAGERSTTGQELEADHAKRVDVSAVIDLALAGTLLGRHVAGGAEHGPLGGVAGVSVDQLGDAEVEQLDPRPAWDLVVRDDHDVVGLEIAMDDPGLVDGGDRRGQSTHGPHRERLRQRSPGGAVEVRAQRLTRDQLHREPRAVGRRLTAIEDVDQPGMIEAAQDVDLGQEPADGGGADRGAAVRRQELERSALADADVTGLDHDPHAAAAERADHAVRPDLHAGREGIDRLPRGGVGHLSIMPSPRRCQGWAGA
jgi:hypothetical protein